MLVDFYGGSYQTGANIVNPGHFLASEGVVVVVPNYRIGNLGRCIKYIYSGTSIIRLL